MRKENSKYVERDGPIRDGCPEASQTCQAGTRLAFDGQDCECRSTLEVPLGGKIYDAGSTKSECCKDQPTAPCHARCSTPSGGSGACAKQTPPISYYEKIGGPVQTVTCCSSGNENNPCEYTGDYYTAIEICNLVGEIHRECEHGPDNYPDEGCTNGKIANLGGNVTIPLSGNFKELVKSGMDEYSCSKKPSPSPSPSPPSPPSPPSIRNDCKSNSDCDAGYSCHRNKCKQDQSSPLTGQGSNKGGMSGGEIAGIVVGSVAGAILLLLAVGALLRGSGKKGKKK